jgi:glutamine amidotransferase
MRIAVVDAGMGNLRSVEKALATVVAVQHGAAASQQQDPAAQHSPAASQRGAVEVIVTGDPDVVRRADKVVVPGQGAFGDCGRALSRQAPLGRAIVDAIGAGRPYLGICLGLQVLFERSEEAPDCPGLGVLRGEVVRLPLGERDADGARLKVPHMGWNEVVPARRPHPLLAAAFAATQHNEAPPRPARATIIGQPPVAAKTAPAARAAAGAPFYFVHSYHARPAEPFLVAATARYGSVEITAAVAVDNVFAVQFHPEKSQRAGLALLRAFVEAAP